MTQAGWPIITLKQAEAFYWTATLRSLVQAAQRLHLAQSTLSKRVSELETTVSARLFDRSSRAMELTRVGQRLLPIAADLLATEARLREGALGPRTFSGPFRFGVTKLVALTWLPKLIAAMGERYPAVMPQPEVDASRLLFERLADGRLDFVVGLDPPVAANLRAVPLGHVTLQWSSAPGAGPAGETVPLAELAEHPIVAQGDESGVQRLFFE